MFLILSARKRIRIVYDFISTVMPIKKGPTLANNVTYFAELQASHRCVNDFIQLRLPVKRDNVQGSPGTKDKHFPAAHPQSAPCATYCYPEPILH